MTASVISDERAFVAEQDYRAANGIGDTRTLVGVTTLTPELRAGMEDMVPGHRFASVSAVPVDAPLTPELSAATNDIVPGHRFALSRVAVAEITVTPELSAGMHDLVPGHRFNWVTPELRAGIEG